MTKYRINTIVLLLLVVSASYGQLRVQSIGHNEKTKSKLSSTRGRQAGIALTLPFWDDFFQTSTSPSVERWDNSTDVFVNNGLAINPPSLGVATLDGSRGNGQPHNLSSSESTKTDSLKSCAINLESLGTADDVYLSFFYQFGGNGDTPDIGQDSLRVEFKDVDGNWVSVWPAGAALDDSGDFSQVLVAVDEERFFHDAFQFKFQSFGGPNGPFDVWNVDYIYLNEGRSAFDTSYPDRTIISTMTSPFGDYFAIPYGLFEYATLVDPAYTATSLESVDQQPFAMDIGVQVETWLDSVKSSSDYFADSVAPEPITASPLQRGKLSTTSFSNIVPEAAFIPADSAYLNYEITLRSKDDEDDDYDPTVYSPIRFSSNDTINFRFELRDYYAYDDGSAEFIAGLNSNGTRLVYKYYLPPDTTLNLNAIDIYFPIARLDPTGLNIDLQVYTVDATGVPGNLIRQERTQVLSSGGINQLVRYEFSSSVKVTDSVFVGYRQAANAEFGVGMDANTDTGERIYSYASNTWTQNTTIAGSLLMRPVFGEEVNDPISSIEEPLEHLVNVYPNPVGDQLNVSFPAQNPVLMDVNGRVLLAPKKVAEGFTFNTASLPSGLYLVRFQAGTNVFVRKVIKY